jgi:hypothetical protein
MQNPGIILIPVSMDTPKDNDISVGGCRVSIYTAFVHAYLLWFFLTLPGITNTKIFWANVNEMAASVMVFTVRAVY